MISEVIIGQFARIGARVLTAHGADLTSAADDPTRTLIRQVLAAVAQFDKTVIVLKLRAARERKRRNTGRCEGRKPFGTHPSEVRTLARIQELLRKPKLGKRLSLAALAERLNAEGHSTRSGRPWAPGSGHAILTRLARRTRVGQLISNRR
jgi:DNA invertase Pin-like site-specific DNA recombinase